MRIHAIAGAAIYLVAGAGCSGEMAQRPPANDPTSVAAEEAPFKPPRAEASDPLLNPAPPTSAEPSPTGTEQVHSATTASPGNPPMRAEPGGKSSAHDQDSMPGMHHPQQGSKSPKPPATTLYTCPMHPEIRAKAPGQCPKCGMTLVPVEPNGGDR